MELTEELSFRDFFQILRRRKKEFLLCWGGAATIAAIYTFSVTPLYRAEALLRVQVPEGAGRTVDLGAISVALPQPTFNIEQLMSPQILEETVKRLDPGKQPLSRPELDAATAKLRNRMRVQFRERDHQLVSLSVLSPDPRQAAREANVAAQVMVELVGLEMTAKSQRIKQFVENQLKEVGDRLRDTEANLVRFRQKGDPQSIANVLVGKMIDLRNRRTEYLQKYTSSHPLVQALNAELRNIEAQLQVLPDQQLDIARITRQARMNEDLFMTLTKRLEEARIMESASIAPVSVTDPASVPGFPETPNKRFNLAVGLLAGFFLGLTVVLARHHFDTSMVTPEEIEKFLQLPVLAAIPHIERRSMSSRLAGPIIRRRDPLGETRSRLIVHFAPQSGNSEVHHLLRNNLMRNTKSGESQVYLFTSAVTGEGKSITAANFAIAAAQAGITTLLVEVDLRRPMVGKYFGLSGETGLTGYFYNSPRWEASVAHWEQIKSGSSNIGKAINQDGLANLHVLPSGKLPTNPVALLSSDRFVRLMEAMRQRYQLVILDCAPALLFADASIVGSHADGVILVYRFGRTAREVLRRAHNQLVSSGAKILGVAVNDIMQGDVARYNSYYGMYGYYEYESHNRSDKPEAKSA